MRVLVTGGTGFIGSHCVAELLGRGHAVRLLVRNPARVARSSAPLQKETPAYSVGDVSDRASVERAMAGCDAVLHAAAVYSLDVRDADAMRRINAVGTLNVLNAAGDRGLDPIIHVSSHVTLSPTHDGLLTANAAVASPLGAYSASKADAERAARSLQERGLPVVIGYPGAVFGPHDMRLGESTRFLCDVLAGRMPVIPRGGICIVDVRDLAAAFATMLEAGQGPRRYLLGGVQVSLAGLVDLVAEVTDRRIRRWVLPPWALRPGVRLAGHLQRLLPVRLPLSEEGFDTVVRNARPDDSAAACDLGFSPRDLHDTLADTCHWAYRRGWISRHRVGRLATTR
ncbi:SDR family NAD(P)-dependent oxidoreductase [Thioalkalivibrio paradoxus]|uniref:Oxidoreductase n=1 Tax=Thioalkalivibrio paradoxus ARh 1 TaxID=713585 RepID=W0DJU4_9GAMM|nr:SDR family NAD(P)-dependent oxidoreductase [Thioalkalivibrio paradoxus]AHE98711.1 oxidoreductase [Thioalkalivibrio paradoxus ARh 1]